MYFMLIETWYNNQDIFVRLCLNEPKSLCTTFALFTAELFNSVLTSLPLSMRTVQKLKHVKSLLNWLLPHY